MFDVNMVVYLSAVKSRAAAVDRTVFMISASSASVDACQGGADRSLDRHLL